MITGILLVKLSIPSINWVYATGVMLSIDSPQQYRITIQLIIRPYMHWPNAGFCDWCLELRNISNDSANNNILFTIYLHFIYCTIWFGRVYVCIFYFVAHGILDFASYGWMRIHFGCDDVLQFIYRLPISTVTTSSALGHYWIQLKLIYLDGAMWLTLFCGHDSRRRHLICVLVSFHSDRAYILHAT